MAFNGFPWLSMAFTVLLKDIERILWLETYFQPLSESVRSESQAKGIEIHRSLRHRIWWVPSKSSKEQIQRRVQQAQPILESFGNAVTMRTSRDETRRLPRRNAVKFNDINQPLVVLVKSAQAIFGLCLFYFLLLLLLPIFIAGITSIICLFPSSCLVSFKHSAPCNG